MLSNSCSGSAGSDHWEQSEYSANDFIGVMISSANGTIHASASSTTAALVMRSPRQFTSTRRNIERR